MYLSVFSRVKDHVVVRQILGSHRCLSECCRAAWVVFLGAELKGGPTFLPVQLTFCG